MSCSSKVRKITFPQCQQWLASLGVNLHMFVCSGWPKLLWVLSDSRNLSKPPREYFPLIKDANNDTAYIEVKHRVLVCWTLYVQMILMQLLWQWVCFVFDWQYKTCKDGSVMGITVSRMAMFTHCQTLTQTCGYTEGKINTPASTYSHSWMNVHFYY